VAIFDIKISVSGKILAEKISNAVKSKNRKYKLKKPKGVASYPTRREQKRTYFAKYLGAQKASCYKSTFRA
jgi:hypothetical protein